MDGTDPVKPTSAPADVADAATAPPSPPRPQAPEVSEAPASEESKQPDSLLFFSGLLKTHRTMEREARAAKLSNLRIV
jgi:hypothetical protein